MKTPLCQPNSNCRAKRAATRMRHVIPITRKSAGAYVHEIEHLLYHFSAAKAKNRHS